MATDRILPDTCAWIDFFRGRQTPLAAALEKALLDGAAVLCGVVVYELLQGLRSSGDGKGVVTAFGSLPFLEMTVDGWTEAGRLSALLRSRGHTLPLSDILIATLAMKHHVTVLTVDSHFSHISGLTVSQG